MKIKNIHIIINPAAGKLQPILPIINSAFKDTGIDWNVSICKKFGDGTRFAKEFSGKTDLVTVYGGDGTVMEVMNGLIETPAPLAIFPGGTANVMAVELGIPLDLKEACELITKRKGELKKIDVGKLGRRHFILRTGMGFEAEMVKGADRKIKNRWGRLAYILSAFSALKKIKFVRYDIVIDEKEHSAQGLDCIIANAGSVGFSGLTLDQKIHVCDGLLDVIVLKKVDLSLIRYVWRILTKGNPSEDRALVAHWQGKDIKITARPAQNVICDGENLGKIDMHAKILPQAVEILVPKARV